LGELTSVTLWELIVRHSTFFGHSSLGLSWFGHGGPTVRLTALVQGNDHVCCRYRIAAFRPFLERAGYNLDIRSLPKNWWPRIRLFNTLGDADVVILQRKLLHFWQLHILRRKAPVLIFDFDDAIFLRNSYSPKGMLSRARMRRFGAMIRAADAVVAGNTFLRERVWTRQPGSRVHLIPTSVDPERYTVARHNAARERVELVWIGSSSTLRGLEQSRALMREIARQSKCLRLKLICDRFASFDDLPVVNCKWSNSTEAADLASSDIGISWVPDDLWSRGKCGLKILQYMAAGLPVVANPVGVQAELVNHGVTGFLAETPAQWSLAIDQLAHDPALRRQMGQAGRARVESEYSVAAGAARWLLLLDELKHRRRAA
jgi:glycosyltransferase involved in cell wall biosynthesis